VSASLGPGYLWLGPHAAEARAAYGRARLAGLRPLHALVIGCIASFKDAWAFRHTIAAKVGCSVRTVQRAMNAARALGLIQVWRAKKGEVPKGLREPLKCGWSHRITVGFGLAAAAVQAAVAAARVKYLLRFEPPKAPKIAPVNGISGPAIPIDKSVLAPRPKTANQLRSWTAEELEAELDRLERAKAPPE